MCIGSSNCDTARLLELRQAFVTLLKSAYQHQLNDGELDGRVGFVAVTLEQGLEFAADRVAKGEPLQDWKYSSFWSHKLENRGVAYLERASAMLSRSDKKNDHISVEQMELRVHIHRALAFIKAHHKVQGIFMKELCESENELSDVEKAIDNLEGELKETQKHDSETKTIKILKSRNGAKCQADLQSYSSEFLLQEKQEINTSDDTFE